MAQITVAALQLALGSHDEQANIAVFDSQRGDDVIPGLPVVRAIVDQDLEVRFVAALNDNFPVVQRLRVGEGRGNRERCLRAARVELLLPLGLERSLVPLPVTRSDKEGNQ